MSGKATCARVPAVTPVNAYCERAPGGLTTSRAAAGTRERIPHVDGKVQSDLRERVRVRP
jgi:hypothetical protein